MSVGNIERVFSARAEIPQRAGDHFDLRLTIRPLYVVSSPLTLLVLTPKKPIFSVCFTVLITGSSVKMYPLPSASLSHRVIGCTFRDQLATFTEVLTRVTIRFRSKFTLHAAVTLDRFCERPHTGFSRKKFIVKHRYRSTSLDIRS